jgi:type I restriction enzyme S subunit
VKEWPMVALGDHVGLLTGYPFKSKDYTDNPDDTRLISGYNIMQGYLRWDITNRWPVSKSSGLERYRLQANDIVLAMDRPWIDAGLKYAWMNQDNLPCLLVQRTARLRGSETLDVRFLRHLIGGSQFTSYVKRITTGTAVPHISPTDIKSFRFLLPPLPEQQEIAAILDTWDEAITLIKRRIEAARQRKKGLMQRSLSGRVRFPEFEGEEWREVTVGRMGNVVSGGTPSTKIDAYWDGEIQWCTPSEITALPTKYISQARRTITQEGLKNSSAVVLKPRSILVCTRATVGDCAINTVPIATNQGFKNLILANEYYPEFVYYLLSFNKTKLVRYASGSTFLELSKRDFERLKFKVPSFPEQRRIAAVLQTCDREIELLTQKRDALQRQKKGLMQRLLTGRVRVEV